MEFRTIVDIEPSTWKIGPCERMLFVGSCFADNMGKRFEMERFRATTNPYGVMYNPASILHTVERLMDEGRMPFEENEVGTAVFTLGTNHVYILKETGQIVDNCEKRPQRLFEERELTVDECAHYLLQAMTMISQRYPRVRFVLTVSPIRYRKYGYHGSQLSKATLLLAIDKVLGKVVTGKATNARGDATIAGVDATYFPSYELMNDELRDYRFYREDMLHPTAQAVDYIYERMAETFFSADTFEFLKAWKPIREALAHKPFHPESEEYQRFLQQAKDRERKLLQRYIEAPTD